MLKYSTSLLHKRNRETQRDMIKAVQILRVSQVIERMKQECIKSLAFDIHTLYRVSTVDHFAL